MKKNIKFLVIGLIIGIIIATSSVFALSGAVQKTLNYNNIKITLNGNEITPTDANGNYVEPFSIDGTTYLPVRAIANALGLDVNWNGETNTVVLGKDASQAVETVLYEDNNLKVTYIGKSTIYDNDVNIAYDIMIENKSVEDSSNKYPNIEIRDVYVNGFAIDGYHSLILHSGKKAVENISIRTNELQNCRISSIESIEFKLIAGSYNINETLTIYP